MTELNKRVFQSEARHRVHLHAFLCFQRLRATRFTVNAAQQTPSASDESLSCFNMHLEATSSLTLIIAA